MTVQIKVPDWDRHRPSDCGNDSFFPAKRNDGREPSYAKPALVCAECPVREFGCLPAVLKAEAGLGPNTRLGYAAGLTPRERIKLAKGARQFNHGTAAGAAEHYRRGQAPCASCRTAATRARRERTAAATAAGKVRNKAAERSAREHREAAVSVTHNARWIRTQFAPVIPDGENWVDSAHRTLLELELHAHHRTGRERVAS